VVVRALAELRYHVLLSSDLGIRSTSHDFMECRASQILSLPPSVSTPSGTTSSRRLAPVPRD
jgi:hypothetical protein